MKKIFTSAMIFTVGLVMAQTDAYKGVGDIKVNLGANLQDGGTGIVSSVDYGLGESGTWLLFSDRLKLEY